MKTSKSKLIVIFRWLSLTNVLVAFLMRGMGRRVIYIELLGALRSLQWVERLSRWGIEWVDYHAYPGYLPNSDLVVAGQYAAALMEKAFGAAELDLFSETIPGLKGNPKKTHALVYNFLVRALESHGQAYALAEYFIARGMCAEIFQTRVPIETLMAHFKICSVKNRFPRWGSSHLIGDMLSLSRRIGRHSLIRIKKEKVIHANDEVVVDAVQTASTLPSVLYFPHKGITYGKLFEKDQYYSKDTESPFYPRNIQHVELGWILTDQERVKLQADYDDRGLAVTFVYLAKQSVREKVIVVLRHFRRAPGGGGAIARALMLGTLELRLKACRQSFARFDGAKVALLGYDFLFPEAATIALQSYGIKVIAVQERFISAFHTFHASIYDYYCVHGRIVKEQLVNRSFTAIENIVVIGDPRAEKISNLRESARLERTQKHGTAEHVCLVLDFHSDPDPFQNALAYGPDWQSNRFFYEAIITLARTNPDCAFVIRGKDIKWQSIPKMQSVLQSFDGLDNVFVDDQYDKFDRSYELAAMANLVIARYTSLCDQCLAQGIPVLIFEGTADGGNVISRWHDYAPYPIIVHQEQELQARFKQVLREDNFMAPGQFSAMRRDYYDRESGDEDDSPLIRLHRVLDDVYHRKLSGD